MKLLYCAALLAAAGAQAGELLPTQGEESPHLQQRIDGILKPAVAALPDAVKVEPIVESIRLAGRGKRIFLGPLARSSHVTLRVRVTDAGGYTREEVFHQERGAWRGTFRPGQDYDLLDAVATDAAQFVSSFNK